MRNMEFNERVNQRDTKLRRYDNHRTNIPLVDRPITPRPNRTLSQVQYYFLWHNDQTMTIPMEEPQETQLVSDEDFIDYPIEIKDYHHVYRG